MRFITQQTAYINSVSFFANGSPSSDAQGDQHSYANVRHNTGQYNNSTGEFIAPVKGRYMICAGTRTESNVQFFIVINGSDDIGQDGDGDGSSTTDGASIAAIYFLDRGDVVTARVSGGSTVSSTPRHYFSITYLGA